MTTIRNYRKPPAKVVAVSFRKVRSQVCTAVSLCVLSAGSGSAQNVNLGNGALPPRPGDGHDYVTHLAETVSPANGTLNVSLPLPVPPSRGITFPVTLNYNSGRTHQFYSYIAGQQNLQPVDGWSLTAPSLTWSSWSIGYPPYGQQTCHYWSGFVFTDPSGQPHALDLALANTIAAGAGVCLHFEQKFPPGPNGGAYSGNNSFSTVQFSSLTHTHAEGFYAVDLNGCDGYAQTNCQNPPNIKVVGPDGTVYNFDQPSPINGENGSINGTMLPRGKNTEGGAPSYLWLPSSIVDRNGNTVHYNVSYNGGGPSSVTGIDSIGRTFLSANPSASTVTVSGSTYTIAPGAVNVNYTLPTHTVKTTPGYHCSVLFNDSSVKSIINSITLPSQPGSQNLQVYTFQYDPQFGLLTEIRYPTGAWTKYTWKMPPGIYTDAIYVDGENDGNGPSYSDACSFQYGTPVIDTRTVGQGDDSENAVPDLVQTFSYVTNWDKTNPAIWDTKQTVVTSTPRQGTSFTTTYNYNGLQAGQVINANSLIANEMPTESSTSVADANGTVLSKKVESWDSSFGPGSTTSYIDGQFVQKISHPTYTPDGTPSSTWEYDRDLTTVLRKSVTNYLGEQLTFPCQQQIMDGSGNVLSETDIYYDGSSTICGTASGAVQAVNGLDPKTYTAPDPAASRGNATQVTRVNAQGAASTSTYGYDQTGQMISSIDGCGNGSCADMSGGKHTTTYSYADSFAGGNPSGNSNAYVTKITDPLTHTQQFSYNYATGQLASSTDANNQTTHYTYADPLNRLTQTDLPGGGSTKISYDNDAGPSPTVTTRTAASPILDIVSMSKMDGMGRVVQMTQFNSKASDTAYVDTMYNGLGQVHSVSNPYSSGSTGTNEITLFAYDGLGRKVTQTQPDGSKLQWCYDGVATAGVANCPGNASSIVGTWVDSYDEVGNHRQHVSDALGRLVAVMEPNANNSLASETDYGYDLLNNLTRVDQYAAKRGSADAVRGFSYDSLSRLTAAYNPETGTVSYVYDANGNLQQKTDGRSVVTKYQYDALNRLLGKTYANAPAGSLSSCYQYDAAPNGTGRLSASWTQAGACPATLPGTGIATSRTIAGYDQVGRITQEQRCVPGRCTANVPAYNFAYGYDLAGNLDAMGDGLGQIQWSLTHDGAGHLDQITATTAGNIPNPAQLFQSTGYSPAGALQSWSWGALNANTPALLGTRTFDNRLRVSSETVVGHD